MGPLTSELHRDRVMSYLDAGLQEGGNVLAGGGTPGDVPLAAGYYIQPTIVETRPDACASTRSESRRPSGPRSAITGLAGFGLAFAVGMISGERLGELYRRRRMSWGVSSKRPAGRSPFAGIVRIRSWGSPSASRPTDFSAFPPRTRLPGLSSGPAPSRTSQAIVALPQRAEGKPSRSPTPGHQSREHPAAGQERGAPSGRHTGRRVRRAVPPAPVPAGRARDRRAGPRDHRGRVRLRGAVEVGRGEPCHIGQPARGERRARSADGLRKVPRHPDTISDWFRQVARAAGVQVTTPRRCSARAPAASGPCPGVVASDGNRRE
jgi:hypothetical protein